MNKPIRVLLIGSGGREYALARAIATSPNCAKLFAHPGNDAMEKYAKRLPSEDNLVQQARDNAINLVVVGPEQPLVAGIANTFRAAGIAVFGPDAAAARIEGSKIAMKRLADAARIPTANWQAVESPDAARAELARRGVPVVIKTDGLAAGKGVVVAHHLQDAEAAIVAAMTEKRFGAAGERLIFEDALEGEEISYFAFLDGTGGVLPFASARDWKRASADKNSDNTGGMASLSPVPDLSDAEEAEILSRFIHPVDEHLRREGHGFCGVLFAGLIRTPNGLQLLEYNVRFGDPETQAILPRLESDLLELLWACATGALAKVKSPNFSPDPCLYLVLAARGYPHRYETNTVIGGLATLEEEVGKKEEIRVVHAATQIVNGEWRATGGRVLGISARAPNPCAAQSIIRDALTRLDWPQGFHRKDLLRSPL
ncbi:MAG: phosphoribosylamine--glycine ligase [Alphaproteobacteria bacterium]